MKTTPIIIYPPFALFAFACFALSPRAYATCQENCLTNQNTVLGDDALSSNTGVDNTAIGFQTLYSNTTGGNNTAVGAYALATNTTGPSNTGIGSGALANNTTGSVNTGIGENALQQNTTGGNNTAIGAEALLKNNGEQNTAVGRLVLFSNTTGETNVAMGSQALYFNTTGGGNTAIGTSALHENATGNVNTGIGDAALWSNTIGNTNTAIGNRALFFNTTGSENTANGGSALESNTTGFDNTASGLNVLFSNTTGNFHAANGAYALYSNSTGAQNTASGYDALYNNTTGNNNIAVGFQAGMNLTTGNNNIDIGNVGVAGDSRRIRIGKQGTQTATFIAGISGATVPGGVGVIVGTNGQLGTVVSSERFKDAVKPMDKASEAILALKPVTFRYKHELDPDGIPQFGLVAEDVEKVNSDLVARDQQGKPYTVRYDAVNAMLLNEFLKEHREVQEQKATIIELKSVLAQQQTDFQATAVRQQKQIEALTAGLQKVSAQLEVSKSEPHKVVTNK